jgi:hypothetical protein
MVYCFLCHPAGTKQEVLNAPIYPLSMQVRLSLEPRVPLDEPLSCFLP